MACYFHHHGAQTTFRRCSFQQAVFTHVDGQPPRWWRQGRGDLGRLAAVSCLRLLASSQWSPRSTAVVSPRQLAGSVRGPVRPMRRRAGSSPGMRHAQGPRGWQMVPYSSPSTRHRRHVHPQLFLQRCCHAGLVKKHAGTTWCLERDKPSDRQENGPSRSMWGEDSRIPAPRWTVH